MAKRSPILGYNHNVRHRGIIFHVQTEDSGVDNPHIFTHLFHLGVIISTRKLLYDAGSSIESVKALMQSQHKAALKELKAGQWDAKIDQYLGGTPGLEPAPAHDRSPRDTLVEPPPPPPAADLLDDQVTPPAGSSLSEAVLAKAVPADAAVAAPPAGAPRARRATAQPPVGIDDSNDDSRSEVSNAFRAIAPDEGTPIVPDPNQLRGRGAPERTAGSSAMAAVRAAAASSRGADTTEPRSVAGRTGAEATDPHDGVPRSTRHTPSGQYSQHRVGVADVLEVHDQPTAPLPRSRERRERQTGAGQRQPPVARPAARPQQPAATARGSGPAQPRAGVVVSRPAVIVGGPPRVVGSPASGDLRPPAVARRGREEPNRTNLFGKDLISEKSLDEVILAYLSEDAPDE